MSIIIIFVNLLLGRPVYGEILQLGLHCGLFCFTYLLLLNIVLGIFQNAPIIFEKLSPSILNYFETVYIELINVWESLELFPRLNRTS